MPSLIFGPKPQLRPCPAQIEDESLVCLSLNIEEECLPLKPQPRRRNFDEEFEEWLPSVLRKYLREKLEPQKASTDPERHQHFVTVFSTAMTDPTFASVVAAFSALRSQETQAKINYKLQLMIIAIAILSALASIVQLVVTILHTQG